MAIALNKRKNIFTDNPFFKEVSKTVKNIANETGKTLKGVTKEVNAIKNNIKNSTKKIADNVAKGTFKVIKDVAKETHRVVTNVAKETKRIAKNVKKGSKVVVSSIAKGKFGVLKNVADETNRIIYNVAKETYKIATNVTKGTLKVIDDVGKEGEKIVKDVIKETQRIRKNIVKEVSYTLGLPIFFEDDVTNELKKGVANMRPIKENELPALAAMIVSKNEVYDEELWDKPIDEKDKKKNEYTTISGEKIMRLKRYKDKETGLDALLIRRENGDIELFFQGSNPAIHYPISAPFNTLIGNTKEKTKVLSKENTENYNRDWKSNSIGNMTREQLILAKTVALAHGPNAYNKFLELEKEFSSNEKGTPKQLIKALEIANKVKSEYREEFKRVSGHSLGGAEAIYVASHLNLEAIAIDPAPVNNPGKFIDNKKMLAIIPNKGKGTLNKIVPNKNGGKTYEFAPLNEYTSNIVDKAVNLISGQGHKTKDNVATVSVKSDENHHEVNINDMKNTENNLRKKAGWSR